MLAGMYFDSPALWRHGLLTELGGLDLADAIRVLWCKWVPPGPFPMNKVVNGPNGAGYIGFMSFHHSVSLLAGIPVCFYFSRDARFQWMGALMAGGPLISIPVDLFMKCKPPSQRPLHILSDFYMNSMFFYQRLILYFPLAYSLLVTVYDAAEVPIGAKLSLFLGGASLSVFNVLCAVLGIYGSYNKWI